MALTPAEIWPMLAAGAGIVFGAGQLVEKIKTSRLDEFKRSLNGTYIKAELCAAFRKAEDERWIALKETLTKLDTWVDKQKERAAE